MTRLAREFTAFALYEPHTALRHSEALLLDDQNYTQIFSPRHDLDLYRLSLDVHTRLRGFLTQFSEDQPLLGETLENWLYPLAAMSSYTLTRLRQPTMSDLLNVDLDYDTAIDLAPDEVTEWYLIQAWSAPARDVAVLRQTDNYGASVRAR